MKLLAPFALLALYSGLSQWLMLRAPEHGATLAFVMLPLALGGFSALWANGWRLLAGALAAALGLGLWELHRRGGAHLHGLYVTEHASMYGMLAFWFWRSLRGEPLITRLARAVHALTPEMERYTVKLTRAWAVFLAGIALTSVTLFVLLPFAGWATFANLGSPLVLGAFFVGEHVLRYRWHPEFDRASLWASVQAWREREQPGRQAGKSG